MLLRTPYRGLTHWEQFLTNVQDVGVYLPLQLILVVVEVNWGYGWHFDVSHSPDRKRIKGLIKFGPRMI